MYKRQAKDYEDVTYEHMLVDNCAMQLVNNPRQFDVILTENMFGDILSDEASMITGSIGMLSSCLLYTSADYIEPNRKIIPGLIKVRKLAFEDLDACAYEILNNTINYLTECGQEIDQRTIKTYEYYKNKKEN